MKRKLFTFIWCWIWGFIGNTNSSVLKLCRITDWLNNSLTFWLKDWRESKQTDWLTYWVSDQITGERTDRQTYLHTNTHTQTDRQKNKLTDWETDRQTEKQTDRLRDRLTNRQIADKTQVGVIMQLFSQQYTWIATSDADTQCENHQHKQLKEM